MEDICIVAPTNNVPQPPGGVIIFTFLKKIDRAKKRHTDRNHCQRTYVVAFAGLDHVFTAYEAGVLPLNERAVWWDEKVSDLHPPVLRTGAQTA